MNFGAIFSKLNGRPFGVWYTAHICGIFTVNLCAVLLTEELLYMQHTRHCVPLYHKAHSVGYQLLKVKAVCSFTPFIIWKLNEIHRALHKRSSQASITCLSFKSPNVLMANVSMRTHPKNPKNMANDNNIKCHVLFLLITVN